MFGYEIDIFTTQSTIEDRTVVLSTD
jgi:hypothetical protein